MCGFLQVTVLCQAISNKVWIKLPLPLFISQTFKRLDVPECSTFWTGSHCLHNMLALTKFQRGAKMLTVELHSCHVYACIERPEKLQGSEVKNFMVVIYWSVR